MDDTARQIGRVSTYVKEKGYGFIQNETHRDLFFHHKQTERDLIGRTHIAPGTEVSFVMAKLDGRMQATRVLNIDPSLDEIDAQNYTEYGQVNSWNPDRGFGYIRRPCGSGLRFEKKNIVSIGTETIREGTWLLYGIFSEERRDGFTWSATNIYVCEPVKDEIAEHFLSVEELPVEVPAQSLAESSSPLLAPATRNMSLIEIIRLRRKGKTK